MGVVAGAGRLKSPGSASLADIRQSAGRAKRRAGLMEAGSVHQSEPVKKSLTVSALNACGLCILTLPCGLLRKNIKGLRNDLPGIILPLFFVLIPPLGK